MKTSIFLTSFFSTYRTGSNPFPSPAMRQEKPEASKCVTGPMPHLPSSRAFQVSRVPIPTADTRPTPVITTRRVTPTALVSAIEATLFLCMSFDIGDGFLDSGDLFGVLVWNLETELLLQRHDQFHPFPE